MYPVSVVVAFVRDVLLVARLLFIFLYIILCGLSTQTAIQWILTQRSVMRWNHSATTDRMNVTSTS